MIEPNTAPTPGVCRMPKVGFFMAKVVWREGRINKHCAECAAETTGYVDTGKEPYALCMVCAKKKGFDISLRREALSA